MKFIHSLTLCLAAGSLCVPALAGGTHKHPATAKTKSPVAETPLVVPAASAEQFQALALTLMGSFDCGEKQTLTVTRSTEHDGYVVLHLGKEQFTMKPVRSDTGAVRLEDVRGTMLMVQIPSKSMLMNTKLGLRVEDACRNDQQRAEVDAPNALGISAPGQVAISEPVSPALAKR